MRSCCISASFAKKRVKRLAALLSIKSILAAAIAGCGKICRRHSLRHQRYSHLSTGTKIAPWLQCPRLSMLTGRNCKMESSDQEQSVRTATPIPLLLVLLLQPTCGWATTSQPLEAVRNAIEHFVTGQQAAADETTIQVGLLDPRLKLRQCPVDLEVFWTSSAQGHRHRSVGVRCRSQISWKIYVPVTIETYKYVWSARRTMRRGEILGEKDLKRERRNIHNLLHGYVLATENVSGQILTRNISAGRALVPNMTRPADVVNRGESITLLATLGSTTVRMSGTALKAGRKGDLIRVRNTSSQRIIEGYVVARGLVEVLQPHSGNHSLN